MGETVPLEMLKKGYNQFRGAVVGMPGVLFARPMTTGGWSARDTVAHLAGWNDEMVRAGQDILAGRSPAYYAETGIDYRDLNAGFVAKYVSKDRAEMLALLAETMGRLSAFAQGLDPAELDSDHGVVHYRGGVATVARALDSLGRDYLGHAEEIAAWLDKRRAQARSRWKLFRTVRTTDWVDFQIGTRVPVYGLKHPNTWYLHEPIYGAFSGCFESCSPEFNYYGPTLYQGKSLVCLRGGMEIFTQALAVVSDRGSLVRLLTEAPMGRNLLSHIEHHAIDIETEWPAVLAMLREVCDGLIAIVDECIHDDQPLMVNGI